MFSAARPSSAFDTVDHQILIKKSPDWVGISGTAFNWFTSYATDRSFSISLGDFVISLSSVPHLHLNSKSLTHA